MIRWRPSARHRDGHGLGRAGKRKRLEAAIRRRPLIAGPIALAIALASLLAAGTPARAAELIMFWKPGCPWCEAWEREVGEIYPKTDEAEVAPLRRQLITAPRPEGVVLDEPPRYTPTFVLVHDGREVGRIAGYPGDANFWGLLGRLLERLPEPARAPSG